MTTKPPRGSSFRYDEIGQRLRAFRIGSTDSADQIAAKLGISKTALYRLERGGLAKIEMLERLADLFGVSVPTLLGVGIEYVPSAVSYFERVRQIEEQSDHIVALSAPISLRLASDAFVDMIEEILTENVADDAADRGRALSDIPKVMKILRERRTLFDRHRPAIVTIVSGKEIARVLKTGLVGREGLPKNILKRRRALAIQEITHLKGLLENPPIGVQIGVLRDTLPHVGFQLFRQPDRKVLVSSPFRIGGEPNIRVGVAMITSAPDALSFHDAAVDEMWGRALKAGAAAAYVSELIKDATTDAS
ncbi:MAG: helix-turn-helix transcriptional regulator [Beijerinckiaceae bacterium]|nr:helix-turn-helix transcriptional regulator [Beijerinckiaceae bacterium]